MTDEFDTTRAETGVKTTATTETTRTEYRPTLGEISHTHPDTGEAFGAAIAYKRGPVVAADGGREPDGSWVGQAAKRSDGGEREAVDRGSSEDEAGEDGETGEERIDANEEERMRDIDHAPPDDGDVNRVYERGGEGRPE